MNQRRKGIAVVIKGEGDKILLMQRGPNARTESGYWENPGGEIEANEESKDAAKREMKEELGVEINIIKLLYSQEFEPDAKGVIWSIEIFEGDVASGTPSIQEPDKCSAIAWFSKEELNSIPLTTYTRSDFVRFGWVKE
ncbi:MAG: CTP pyrophosphohydrolase [Anaerolineales bacterium]|nr:CTP pyrophosphohydrolase [Anaerolineales bacterium]